MADNKIPDSGIRLSDRVLILATLQIGTVIATDKDLYKVRYGNKDGWFTSTQLAVQLELPFEDRPYDMG